MSDHVQGKQRSPARPTWQAEQKCRALRIEDRRLRDDENRTVH